MKIKASTIVLLLSTYCIAIESSWPSVFGIQDRRLLMIKQLIYIVLFLYCRFGRNAYSTIKPYIKRIDILLLLTVGLILIFIVYSIMVQGVAPLDACDTAFMSYTKFLFVYPLLYLFNRFSFKRITVIFLVICIIPLIYHFIVAMMFNTSGTIINDIILDSEKLRIRNGLVRVNTLPLSWAIVLLGFAFSLYLKKKKICVNAVWVITLLLILIVNQSRNLYVALFISIIVMYLFKEKKGKKKIIAALVVCSVVVILIQSGLINDFVASFAKNTEGDTLTERIKYLELFFPMYLKHPIMGFGLIGSSLDFSKYKIYFIDYGIIGDIMQAGLFAIAVYAGTIYILVKNTIALNKRKGIAFTINSGMLAFLLVGLIGYTMFQDSRNFALPCIWAISEYTFVKQKRIQSIVFGGINDDHSTS